MKLRERRRIRRSSLVSDLLVSLVSSAILAAGAKLLSVVGTPALAASVPIWVLVGTVTATALLAYLLGSRAGRGADQVFISVSAITHTRWLADLVTNLSRSLDRYGLELVVKLPPHDHSGRAQLAQLTPLRKGRSRYVGGFFVSTEPERVPRELADMCRRIDRPVVFVDVRPFPESGDYPARTAYVGCDPEEIGGTAARWVAKEMTGRGIERPVVLVVAGKAQEGRQDRFEQVLRERLPGSDVTVSTGGEFAREKAREIVDQYLRHPHHGARLDAIFCTNDEMALGAVDAVQARTAAGISRDDLVIIGVDGIPEAIATIKANNTPFRATIVQDTRRIAEFAVDTLARIRSGETVDTEILVPTAIYPMG